MWFYVFLKIITFLVQVFDFMSTLKFFNTIIILFLRLYWPYLKKFNFNKAIKKVIGVTFFLRQSLE